MVASDLLSSKALIGLETIMGSIEPRLQETHVSVSSAVKELVGGILSSRDTAGRSSPPEWQRRAAVQLLQPFWQDEAPSSVSASGPHVADFVSNLLAEIDALWSELASTAGGESAMVDAALVNLAEISSSGLNQRRSVKDAALQAAIDVLAGIRLELGP